MEREVMNEIQINRNNKSLCLRHYVMLIAK